MNKMNLRKTATRNASFALLTVVLLLACGCWGVAEKKDSGAGQRAGWNLPGEILSRIVAPTFPDRDFNVTDYGAKGDSVTDCNPAFKKAIAACTKAGVLIGRSRVVEDGVTLTLDRDIDGEFEVRVYEKSTFIIPDGRTFKIKGPLIVDRTGSVARQLGGTVEIAKNLDIDTTTGQYVIEGGSLSCGKLSLNEGMFVVDDRQGKIKSVTVRGEYRTGDGEGNTTTKFVAHKGGVASVRCQDQNLNAYMGEHLVVDVSAYDYAKHGDLVLLSYTGTRKDKFDGGPEKPEAQVKIIGAKADLIYDDAKNVKLTSFRP